MSVIELNQESVEVTQILHSMSRASICKFRIAIIHESGSDIGAPADIDDSDARFSLGDSELLDHRQEVRYTDEEGRILFAGKVLPASRSIDVNSESVEYTAADIVEFLGNNPCDEVNKFYNRNRNDSIVIEYPQDQTIEEILETEFERLIGSSASSEHLIAGVDWDKAEDLRNLVVRDFATEGKTWRQLLDDLRNEIPMLGYWFDPRTANNSNHLRGYTLRFYNLSPRDGGDDAISDSERIRVVHTIRDGLASVNRENVQAFRFEEDISQSYDKLTIKTWGHLYERRERLENGWQQGTSTSGTFSNPEDYPNAFSTKTVYPLRFNSELQRWERYSDAGQGQWLSSAGSVWTPDRDTVDARRAFRRYKIPDKSDGSPRRAIDVKLDIENLPDGSSQIIEVGPATKLETLAHQWQIGSLSFTINSTVYLGFVSNGVKSIVFTGGEENDWGDFGPNPTYYPDYPNGPGGVSTDPFPLFDAGPIAAIEENMVLLQSPLVAETRYIFVGNTDGGNWNNMMNELVSLFWGSGYDVWGAYTAWDDLDVVRENSALGYEKHLVLYEPRFFKYTKLDGTVIRDDTAVVNEFADLLFELLLRPRYFGSATLDVTDLDNGARVFDNRSNNRDIFMGSPVQIENWKPGSSYTAYRPSVLVQSIELSKRDTEQSVTIGFDNPQTFIPLENTQQFRAFFEGSFDRGFGGTNSNGGCGCAPTNQSGGGGGGGGGGGFTTEPDTSTGTGPGFTTTPNDSSTGTGQSGSTSDTTASSSSTTGTDEGSTSTTTDTTTDGGTTSASTSSSSTFSQSSDSTATATGITGDPSLQADQDNIGSTTTTSTTTPPPAEVFTGVPFED